MFYFCFLSSGPSEDDVPRGVRDRPHPGQQAVQQEGLPILGQASAPPTCSPRYLTIPPTWAPPATQRPSPPGCPAHFSLEQLSVQDSSRRSDQVHLRFPLFRTRPRDSQTKLELLLLRLSSSVRPCRPFVLHLVEAPTSNYAELLPSLTFGKIQAASTRGRAPLDSQAWRNKWHERLK